MPAAGFRRALVILSDSEAYWTAIDAEGTLDSSIISADNITKSTISEIATTNEVQLHAETIPSWH